METTEVMALLKENRNERGMAHWKKQQTGTLESYGIGLTVLRRLAKTIGRDHRLARRLWASNYYDAKVIALLIDDPKQMTRQQVEEQVEGLEGGHLAHVFAMCGATLPKAPFAFELACEWMGSPHPTRRRCAWGLVYEFSKMKTKTAPSDQFFQECVERIERTIRKEKDMWVREAMNSALMGIGLRTVKLNKAAIRAAKAIGPVDIDYGDDNRCEPVDVLKHLTSDFVTQRLGT